MIILALPLETQEPVHWQDFRFALDQYKLTIAKITEEENTYLRVQINTSSVEQEKIVVDLVQLCFSKSYQV
jgi:hypothetical protein